jgi:hypothetical protein
MLNDRLAAARPFAEKITAAEAAFNTSINLIGQMIADIPAARAKLGKRVSLTTGMDACEQLASAAMLASQGYRQIVKAHECFAQDRDDLGLRTVGFGDIHDCPPPAGSLEVPANHLSVVKAA